MGDFFNLTMEVKTLVEEHERFRASLNAIRSHDDTDSRCDELELDFEVVGLPQHRLIPVRNIEPITIYALHAGAAHEHVLYSIVEHVAHVQHSRHIGGRNDHGIRLPAVGFRMEKLVFQPVRIPLLLYIGGIVLR